MATLRVPIGILISSEGPYSVVSKSMLCGALLGIAEAQAEHRDLEIEPIIANPRGDNALYSAMASEMLANGIKHVMLLVLHLSPAAKRSFRCSEKADALLWYPSHYEVGSKARATSSHTGAVANQHLLPLVEYLLAYALARRLSASAPTTFGRGRTTGSCARQLAPTAARSWPSGIFPWTAQSSARRSTRSSPRDRLMSSTP